jgi:hypothetical protein
VQTGDISQCFWNNPAPSDGNYRLGNGETKDVEIEIIEDNDTNVVWSGALSGRTGCNADTCETADCGNGDGGCKPGRGFFQPATQGEITMLKDFQDYYDVEVINGVHMGIEFGPTNAPAGKHAYDCGNPGSLHPRTSVAP